MVVSHKAHHFSLNTPKREDNRTTIAAAVEITTTDRSNGSQGETTK
jgi:hypothetical protein